MVVPVRDGAATLGACLEALLADLPDDGEIIVVDDGSRDASVAVASRLEASGRVRLVRMDRPRGPSAARNAGWRATDRPLVAYVDADVVLRPGALARLREALDADPLLLGANGMLDAETGAGGEVSAFVNTSLRYQHLRHGPRVGSAFTSLCVLKRTTLVAMGGWDEHRPSRYADDVATRFVLPPRSIALAPGATGVHRKAVPLRGLLRHRANVGFHFVDAVADRRPPPTRVVLGWRYPANTALAAGWLASLAAGAPGLALGGALAVVSAVVNARFVVFSMREQGPVAGLLAWPLSALEGFAYLAGMASASRPAAARPSADRPRADRPSASRIGRS